MNKILQVIIILTLVQLSSFSLSLGQENKNEIPKHEDELIEMIVNSFKTSPQDWVRKKIGFLYYINDKKNIYLRLVPSNYEYEMKAYVYLSCPIIHQDSLKWKLIKEKQSFSTDNDFYIIISKEYNFLDSTSLNTLQLKYFYKHKFVHYYGNEFVSYVRDGNGQYFLQRNITEHGIISEQDVKYIIYQYDKYEQQKKEIQRLRDIEEQNKLILRRDSINILFLERLKKDSL